MSADRDIRIQDANIAESVRRIDDLVRGGHQAFLASWVIQDALVRNLEIIGEAAKNVSGAFRDAHPAVSQRELARFRDLAIHRYFNLRLDIVWSIAEQSIPTLQAQLPSLQAGAERVASNDGASEEP